MKGLIRDAADFVKPLIEDNSFINKIFKEKDKKYGEEEKLENKFKSATLAYEIKKEYAHLLYHKKSSTKIIEDKQADNQSLRTTEVTIPLDLVGEIKNYTGEVKDLEICFKALKKLGEKRFKGLGRCKVEIINNPN